MLDKKLEPVQVCTVTQSYKVSIGAKYLPVTNHRGSRIVVRRLDGGRDEMQLTVGWDYSLGISDNYAQAINAYLVRQNWGGSWVIGSTDNGYVAVCSSHVVGGE